LQLLNLLLNLPFEFKRMCDSIERLGCSASPTNNDSSVTKHSAPKALIDPDAFNLGKQELDGFAGD
jgi:hypothetical protein